MGEVCLEGIERGERRVELCCCRVGEAFIWKGSERFLCGISYNFLRISSKYTLGDMQEMTSPKTFSRIGHNKSLFNRVSNISLGSKLVRTMNCFLSAAYRKHANPGSASKPMEQYSHTASH